MSEANIPGREHKFQIPKTEFYLAHRSSKEVSAVGAELGKLKVREDENKEVMGSYYKGR